MRKKSQNKSLWLIICLVAILGIGVGIINVGKAQQVPSEMDKLVNFYDELNGNTEAFVAGLEYLGDQVEEMFGAGSRMVNGLSTDTTSPSAGEVRTTTLTVTGDSTFAGDLTTGSSATIDFTNSTNTPGEHTYSTLYGALAAPTASSTATGDGNTDSMVLYSWINTGAAVECTGARVGGLSTLGTDYAASAGTTTCILSTASTCGDGTNSWTVSSTDTVLASTTLAIAYNSNNANTVMIDRVAAGNTTPTASGLLTTGNAWGSWYSTTTYSITGPSDWFPIQNSEALVVSVKYYDASTTWATISDFAGWFSADCRLQ